MDFLDDGFNDIDGVSLLSIVGAKDAVGHEDGALDGYADCLELGFILGFIEGREDGLREVKLDGYKLGILDEGVGDG